MKNIVKIGFLFLIGVVSTSCLKDFLDKTPTSETSEKDIFSSWTRTEEQITRLYFYVRAADRPLNFFRNWSDSPLCDECEASTAESGWTHVFNDGGWEPGAAIYDAITSNTAGGACHTFWPELYADIRRANNILKGLETYRPTPPDTHQGLFTNDKRAAIEALGKGYSHDLFKQRRGEVRFIRAYLHYVLIRNYGECAYIDYPIDPNDLPAFERENVHSIVEKICRDCDLAMEDLTPARLDKTDYGRVDRGACLGLKAMARWIAATPLYNGSTLKNDTRNYATDYQRYDAERWTAAKLACKDVMEHEIYDFVGTEPVASLQYSLFQGSPRGVTTDANDRDDYGGKVYRRLWEIFYYTNEEAMKTEWIWAVLHDKSSGWFTDLYPPSSSGSSREMPLQNQVDEYEIIGPDGYGYPIYALKENHRELYQNLISQEDFNAAYDDENPYQNRDPRFYRDITYHGSIFKGVNVNTYTGADAIGASSSSTTTGYYHRKYMDGSFSRGATSTYLNAPPLIRLTGIHLIYCEAVLQTEGATSEVYDMLNAIRERSFMGKIPPAAVGNKELMSDYLTRERRVEFYHERTRFFTARLYLEPTGQTESRKEVQWNALAGDDNTKTQLYFSRYGAYPKTQRLAVGMRPVEDSNGKIVIDGKRYKMQRFLLERRVFQEKHYLFPIPPEELQNAHIPQNPNW